MKHVKLDPQQVVLCFCFLFDPAANTLMMRPLQDSCPRADLIRNLSVEVVLEHAIIMADRRGGARIHSCFRALHTQLTYVLNTCSFPLFICSSGGHTRYAARPTEMRVVFIETDLGA